MPASNKNQNNLITLITSEKKKIEMTEVFVDRSIDRSQTLKKKITQPERARRAPPLLSHNRIIKKGTSTDNNNF